MRGFALLVFVHTNKAGNYQHVAVNAIAAEGVRVFTKFYSCARMGIGQRLSMSTHHQHINILGVPP